MSSWITHKENAWWLLELGGKHRTSYMHMCRIHLLQPNNTRHLKGRWNVTRISCQERQTRPCARPWKYTGEWSNSSSTICGVRDQLHVPAALPSGFHLIGSWLGLTMGLGGLEKRKICCPCWESKHDTSDVQPVAWPLHWPNYSGFHLDKRDFYARSRKVPITFIMSVRLLSVYPHKSGRLQLV